MPPETPTACRKRSWLPHCLESYFTQDSVRELWYVVVEEIVDDVAGLTVSAWPYADEAGRLRFETDESAQDSFEVSVPLGRLRSELYAGFVEREPHIGDVFAVRLDPDQIPRRRGAHRRRWNRPLAQLFIDVYDISAEARKVAKLAFYASVADVWTLQEATKKNLTEDVEVAADQPAAGPAPHHPRMRTTTGGSDRG